MSVMEPMQNAGEICKTSGCEEQMLLLAARTTKKNLQVIVCPRCDENPQDPGLIARAALG